jgi:hypothetical protein
MRTCLLAAVVCAFVGLSPALAAEPSARDVIQKAIKAHGGEESYTKYKAVQTRNKGTLDLGGGIDFTQETSVQMPGQFKDVMQLTVNGTAITVTTVFDKDKGWIKANGEYVEVKDKLLDALKEGLYRVKVLQLVTLLSDKDFELNVVGEAKVNDRPAVGVRVASKGHNDMTLYFDKEKGLFVKATYQGFDAMSEQQTKDEIVITEYQEINGRQVAKKTTFYRDDKKLMEAESVEVKLLENKLDDSEFAKP